MTMGCHTTSVAYGVPYSVDRNGDHRFVFKYRETSVIPPLLGDLFTVMIVIAMGRMGGTESHWRFGLDGIIRVLCVQSEK